MLLPLIRQSPAVGVVKPVIMPTTLLFPGINCTPQAKPNCPVLHKLKNISININPYHGLGEGGGCKEGSRLLREGYFMTMYIFNSTQFNCSPCTLHGKKSVISRRVSACLLHCGPARL